MDRFERIPVDARWKIASRQASAVPVAYHRAFMESYGDQYYNEIERRVWAAQGREANVIATAFRMPTGNASEVAEALTVASRMLFGPEMSGEISEVSPDRAILVMDECPLVNRAKEMEADPLAACNACHAFCHAAVESLNENFGIHYTQGMCAGNPLCEMIIQRRE